MRYKAYQPVRDTTAVQSPRSSGHLAALALLIATLSACTAVGPDHAAPDHAVPDRWQQASRYESLFGSASPAALSQWWQQLHDPLLSELVERALQASPDLHSAQARLRGSRARIGLAGGALLPSVTASAVASRAKAGRQTGSGAARELYSVGFDASWEIDLFGGARRTLEAAGADYQASQAELQDVQVSLAAEVARTYASYRAIESRIAIARSNLEIQSETLQMADWRVQAGLAGALDVEQARSSREQTRSTIPLLDTSLTEAGNRLAVLLGQQPGALHASLSASASPLDMPSRLAIGIPADMLRRRPDIRAAERRIAAETARLGSAGAALYPAFQLSGSLGLDALTVSALARSGAAGSSLLAALSAPIFNGGRLRQQVRLQDTVRDQALLNYQKILLTALEDVENALVALGNSEQRIAALSIAVDSAGSAALLARHQYSAGLIDFLSVLSTERALLTVEDLLADARSDAIVALIALYKAMGGGWNSAEASTPALPDNTGSYP